MQLEEGFSLKSEKFANELDTTDNPYAGFTTKEHKYQYMMGEAILVAPMFNGETSREVFLPEGKWYDFYTGEFVGEQGVITISPGLDKIPLFVKDGGIIPMIAPQNRMPRSEDKLTLEIRHYGTQTSSSMLYDDDGISFSYENGEYSWATLSVSKQENSLKGKLTIDQKEHFGYKPQAKWIFMTQE